MASSEPARRAPENLKSLFAIGIAALSILGVVQVLRVMDGARTLVEASVEAGIAAAILALAGFVAYASRRRRWTVTVLGLLAILGLDVGSSLLFAWREAPFVQSIPDLFGAALVVILLVWFIWASELQAGRGPARDD